jgi:ATP-dependent DNA helicase DinG
MQDIDDILGPDGPLAGSLPGFRPRRAQLQMARAVTDALEHRTALLVEAGTGTGKTFAYLVPALLAGRRVLVSTGTRTLQDQLYAKDVPLVAGALGSPARVALLKGRSNYLCTYRLKRQLAQRVLEGVAVPDPLLARLESWSAITKTGDLAEVPGMTESQSIWPQVTSTRDNCLGQRCPDYAGCHVVAARRDAQAADLVIVNHHLLLADLALKEDGFGDLLGSADAVILDEAHQLPDLATQFFGAQFSARQGETLLTEGKAALLRGGGSLAEIGPAARTVEAALGAVLAALPRGAARRRWEEAGVGRRLAAACDRRRGGAGRGTRRRARAHRPGGRRRRRAYDRDHRTRFYARAAAVRCLRAVPGARHGASGGLGVHLCDAVRRRGFRAFRHAARTRGRADAAHPEPVRLQLTGDVVPA